MATDKSLYDPTCSLEDFRKNDPGYFINPSEKFLESCEKEVPVELAYLYPLPSSTSLAPSVANTIEEIRDPSSASKLDPTPRFLGAVRFTQDDMLLGLEAGFWRHILNSRLAKHAPEYANSRGVSSEVLGCLAEIAGSRFLANQSLSIQQLVVAGRPPEGVDFEDVNGARLDAKGFETHRGFNSAYTNIFISGLKHEKLKSACDGYLTVHVDRELKVGLLYVVPYEAIKSNLRNGWTPGIADSRSSQWYYSYSMSTTELTHKTNLAHQVLGAERFRVSAEKLREAQPEKSASVLNLTSEDIAKLIEKTQIVRLAAVENSQQPGPAKQKTDSNRSIA